MINSISIHRRLFASLLAMWMSLIVISGVVFMHKEVTSDGEIITHVHPYDFTKKKNKQHHKNDAEIRYLDIVFQGSFIEPAFICFEQPISIEYQTTIYANYLQQYKSKDRLFSLLRGPPTLFNI